MLLISGWICSVIFPASSICGVMSSDIPEKSVPNVGAPGVIVCGLVAVAGVTILGVTLIMTLSSEPILRTAFWLFVAAIRGLDST